MKSSLPGGSPGDVSKLLQNAKQNHKAGRLRAAEGLYRKALELSPNNAEAMHFLGLLQHQQGKGTAAVDLMRRSLALKPDSGEYHSNLGMVLASLGRAEEAIEVLDRAVALNPDHAEAHNNRGGALDRLGRGDEAIAAWKRAVELRPNYAEPHNHLGQKLSAGGKIDEAIAHFETAAKANPRNAEAHNNLGIALRKKGQLAEAGKAFRRATELRPDFAEALSNLGTALNEQGRPDEASGYLQKAADLRPDFVDAHWNLSLSLLARGEFEKGWLEYEWRRHLPADLSLHRSFPQPEWNGGSVDGRTVLVIAEQGLGDTLQFVRYVPLLARRGAKVVLECQPRLRPLLQSVDGLSAIVAHGEPLPRFDTHARLMSLAGIFGTRLGNIPAATPYLRADARRIQQWKSRLPEKSFNIGIAWQGNPTFPGDRSRSIPLRHFAPLAAVPGVRLFSLQKNAGAEQAAALDDQFQLTEFSPALDEGCGAFEDTAAVIMSLDLVITSDTSMAHLAGALGRPVWVGLCFGCDWRFLRNRDDSPWYPTMRLFRQTDTRDYEAVLDRVRGELLRLIAAG
ncbi:MAG TPA: tetratricopeptide repeat protein [Tepidisphaeraceae bacterium]|nr:tetratricopeptide repeat protein [Tepidisphaeraceae bacterium]